MSDSFGSSGAGSGESNYDSTVGRLVVERGLATTHDVERCREKAMGLKDSGGSAGGSQTLGHVLVEEGVITARQLELLRPASDKGVNTQLPGYQVIKKLGAGAMATVYKAKQISLDRMVAIKVLPQKFTKSEDFVRRFYAEGRAAAKLNHPNIVQAFDVANAGPYHYFVMEFVDGRTVFDDIVAKGRYDEQDALKVAIDVTEALAHAHQQGFIHRDVKPKNIMIDDHSGRTKLADMGLARAISDREAAEAEAGKAYGTPYYISPEQIRGEVDVDFRADIYSLGATLYHMVTGKVPFDGPNPSAVMRKHLNEAIVPPDHINASLVSGVAEVIEVCMAKSRDQRYNSTGDLLADLQAIERGEPPLQARRVFDVNSLSALEGNAAHHGAMTSGSNGGDFAEGLDPTLLMWLAIIGWVTALGVLLMLLGVLLVS